MMAFILFWSGMGLMIASFWMDAYKAQLWNTSITILLLSLLVGLAQVAKNKKKK